jgi:ribosomal protein S18 acetylase RimI-like enzyme
MVEKIISEAKSQHAISVQLNVNRFNTESIAFYKKVGFQIIETIDIPLDKFLLEDYVMNFEL